MTQFPRLLIAALLVAGCSGAEATFAGRGTAAWAGDLAAADGGVRDGAASRLAEGGAPALPVLEELLSHSDAGIRSAAVVALGWSRAPSRDAAALLGRALADPEEDVRTFAAQGLCRHPDPGPGVIRSLGARLREDPSPRVRAAAADVLGEGTDDPDALSALRQALADAAGPVRSRAARALARLGVRDAVTLGLLREAMSDHDTTVQIQASQSLAAAGAVALPYLLEALAAGKDSSHLGALIALAELGATARPALDRVRPFLDSPDPSLRAAARRAVAAIGGR